MCVNFFIGNKNTVKLLLDNGAKLRGVNGTEFVWAVMNGSFWLNLNLNLWLDSIFFPKETRKLQAFSFKEVQMLTLQLKLRFY